MKLGTYVEIVQTVDSIEMAVEFYEALNFKKLADDAVTDGSYILRFAIDKMEHPTLNYYGSHIEEIENNTVEWDDNHTCLSPNGVRIALHAESAPYKMPNGDPLSRESLSILGKFGEYTIPVTCDMDSAFNFWLKLSFKQSHRSDDPYPWGIVIDNQIIVGLHNSINASQETLQGDALTEVHISHFATDMIDRIEKMKALGYTVKDMEPLADDARVQNAQMIGPGGQKFYLFTGSV